MSEQINRRDFIKRTAVSTAGLSLAMSGPARVASWGPMTESDWG